MFENIKELYNSLDYRAETQRPSSPPLVSGPRTDQGTTKGSGQPSGHAQISRSTIRPVKCESDLISLEPDLNLSSYPLTQFV
jgi:hypothetical protein